MPADPVGELIVVDTSAYFALVDKSDRHHSSAVAFIRSDCTSFALMERLRITTAFAFDLHFHQYGRFTVVP